LIYKSGGFLYGVIKMLNPSDYIIDNMKFEIILLCEEIKLKNKLRHDLAEVYSFEVGSNIETDIWDHAKTFLIPEFIILNYNSICEEIITLKAKNAKT
jgi:hypothetical protein